MTHADVIVLGGGSMGSAAAWELGKRGLRAVVVEQFGHVHRNGSHSGETRIIRHAYAEGAGYVPFVLRADRLWVDLEEASGSSVFHRVGCLELAGPGDEHARRAKAAADERGLAFEWLRPDEVRRSFPQFKVADDWEAGFGADAGFLDVDAALTALGSEARKHGVDFREHEAATAWGASESGVWVETAHGRYTADYLVVTAGSWAGRMLGDLGLPLRVLRKTLFWLEVSPEDLFSSERCPVYIVETGGWNFYGFPQFGRSGIKVANHAGGELTTPETVVRTISNDEKQEMGDFAGSVLNGVTGKVLDATTCLYTSTPDDNFIIDHHPEHGNVVIAAGFSGHGFKFATAVGEHLVQLLHHEVEALPLFDIERLAGVGAESG